LTRAGPDLTALPTVAGARKPGTPGAAYVRESLVAPQAFVVQGYAGSSTSPAMPALRLTEAEVEALVAYLLSPETGR
ncbi:MAG: hypothetical protein ACRDJN_23340, partial [Chloroflexota bacterium]